MSEKCQFRTSARLEDLRLPRSAESLAIEGGGSGRVFVLLVIAEHGGMSENRKIAAILAADVVGYSRLTGADEDRTLARLRALRSDLIDPTIAVHHGRVVKRTGDGAIVEFRSVVDAVGTLKITEVDEASAVGKFTGAGPAKVGDTVSNAK